MKFERLEKIQAPKAYLETLEKEIKDLAFNIAKSRYYLDEYNRDYADGEADGEADGDELKRYSVLLSNQIYDMNSYLTSLTKIYTLVKKGKNNE